MFLFLAIIFGVIQSEIVNFPETEKNLFLIRSGIAAQLDHCTIWRLNLENAEADQLNTLLDHFQFHEFRKVALEIAAENHPESLECLENISEKIQIFERYFEAGISGILAPSHLHDILSTEQIEELHQVLDKSKRFDLIEKGILQHLHGIPEHRKRKLLSEFFETKKTEFRKKREATINNLEDYHEARDPEPLKDEWLQWQNYKHKNAINKLESNKNVNWNKMILIADQFYHLRKVIRKKYEKYFLEYCNSNIVKIIGNESFAELNSMYSDSEQNDHIFNRFQQVIGNLGNEEDRLTADKYGQFCRRIYRLIQFEPADLMSWLSARQKLHIAEIIQNPEINDTQVYDKLFDYFNNISGAAKEEADEIITQGCRKFIAHHLGDHICEEIEDMRYMKNISSQYIAAFLAIKIQDTETSTKSSHNKRIEETISICKRIYLNYNGSCFCNGHSETCDPKTHVCLDCKSNTIGYQCEACAPETSFNETTSECETKNNVACDCNGNSEKCSNDGSCLDCQNNTFGNNCEMCAVGYFGDALNASCDECPCPKNAECVINDHGILECPDCPKGNIGKNCELDGSNYTVSSTVQPLTSSFSTSIDNQIEV